MKRYLAILASLVSLSASGQTPTFKWQSGSQEIRARSNQVLSEPGPRQGMSTFKDENDDFWIFGGNGTDFGTNQGFFNDTWTYQRSSGVWKWVSGQMSVDQPATATNNSLAFDGIDDIIALNESPLNYNEDFTMEVWFKPTQDGAIMSLSRDNFQDDYFGWIFEIGGDGERIWIVRDCCTVAEINSLSLFDGEWHHLTVVFEKGNGLFSADQISVYLDEFESTVNVDSFIDSNADFSTHTTFIGGFRGDNDQFYFGGLIDEVRFWNKGRNRGEIISNRTIELSGNEDNLVAYYNFNQGDANSPGNTITELVDATGSINGNLIGDVSREAVFAGEMAKVRAWSTALSNEEVQEASKSILIGTEPNLAMAYVFNDGLPDANNTAISSVSDLTNTNEGFLSNFSLDGNQSNFLEDKLRVIQANYNSGGRAVVTADLDNDTFEDVIAANFNSQSINILLNNQDGSFGNPLEFDVGTHAHDLTVGHWNDDAIPDIAVAGGGASGNDERVRIFFGDGSAGFSNTMDITFPIDSEPSEVQTADIDKDTNDDLIVILRGEDRIEVHYGDGLGGFSSSSSFDLGISHFNKGFVIDDFTNDNYPDIAFSLLDNNNCGKIGMLINDQNGSFLNITYPSPGCLYISEMLTTDFNGDGNVDLVFHDSGAIGSVIGNGDGTLGEVYFLPTPSSIRGITLLDINGDAIEDIITVDIQDNTITTYLGNSTGEFTLSTKVNIKDDADDIVKSDLDKNGIMDLIVGHGSSRTSVVLREDLLFDQVDLTYTLSFDGSDDYVQIPNLKEFDANFTIEGWIKTLANGPIFSFTDNDPSADLSVGMFSIAIKDNSLTFLGVGIPDIQANDSYSINDGNWHHFAVVVNIDDSGNETVEFFVDGINAGYEDGVDFDGFIDNTNASFSAKLGYASNDFKNYLGTTGQASSSNWTNGIGFPEPVNGRAYNAYWSDNNGDFFIFGGQGENGIFNSIRKFDKIQLEWVTIKGGDNVNDLGNYGTKGVSDVSNIPPARWEVNATIDSDGNVWSFGGAGDEARTNNFNDLWKYNPVTNEWVWISGESTVNQSGIYGEKGISNQINMPGARGGSQIWSDSDGYIWIFGGIGFDSQGTEGYLNDLWKYDPAASEWTWISGSDLADQPGIFGDLDEYNDSNQPGGRKASLQWIGSDGIVWFFGGNGVDKFGISVGYLNDLWSYNSSNNQWAWHAGSDFKGSTGSYNEKGLSSTEYVPGSRFNSGGWIDEENNLWLFGGFKFNQLSTGNYNDFWKYEPTTKKWTWLSGLNSTANINQTGVYGNLNEGAAPHPGSRHGGLTWTDLEGDFWMLGGAEIGSSTFGFYNDLWKYQTRLKQWSYILGDTELSLNEGVYGSKGIGNATNDPRSRWHGASWTAQDGKLWFFGGINNNPALNDIAWLNDLWYYDPQSNVYTWVGGSSNINAPGVYGIKGEASTGHIPGARSSSAYWSDEEGNFWIFGGYESFEYNNDLWKFNPNTQEWTWISGNNFQNSPGIYGELGITDPTNSIGARRYTDGRMDKDGNVWFFGGDGHDSQAQRGWLGDLWKYDTHNNTWTWMTGSQFRNIVGNYGVKGIASPENNPPPRYGHASWLDDSGNLWLFGGFGLLDDSGSLSSGQLNDLWKYDTKTNLWTWVGGDNTFDSTGEFGVQGEFSETNLPVRRARAQAFATNDKSLWLFGGRESSSRSRNDFWEIKFTPGQTFIEEPSNIQQTEFTITYDEPWARAYRIQISSSDDFTNSFFDQTTSDRQTQISDLQPGTYYHFQIEAINEIGNSGYTASTQVLTLPVTPTFTSLNAVISDLTSTQAHLNWQPTEGVLDGYNIDVSTDPSFEDPSQVHEDFDVKFISLGQSQELTNLTPGTHYYARLQSVNSSGTSPYSQTVAFLTKPEIPTYDPETVVSEISQSTALLSWNEVPEILNGYKITISTLDDSFVNTDAILTDYNNLNISKDESSIEVRGLQPGTQYFAFLASFNSSGDSDLSEKITILTTPASPVFNLETGFLSISQNDVTLNWEAPQGFFEGFLLEVSIDFSFANTNLMLDGYGRNGSPREVSQSELTHVVSGLSPGQTYFTRIRAINESGESPNSNILTLLTVPSAPDLNPANNLTQTSSSITWSAISGADEYLIDLSTSVTFGDDNTIFSNRPTTDRFIELDNLNPGIRYFIRVQSSNSSGSSGAMNPADYGATNFITVPNTPVLDDELTYTQSSFDISWPEVEGASSYIVDASDNFFQTFLNGFNGLDVSDNSVTISGLDPNEEYQFRVRSKNESGESPNASLFDLQTLPATPISRDASNVSSSRFTVNWDPALGAEFYNVEVSLDDFQTFHFNEQLSSSNPVVMMDITAGVTYKYRVQAVNFSGPSPYSNVVSVVPQNNAQSLNISEVEFNGDFQEGTGSTTVTARLSGGLGDPEVLIRYKGILSSTWSDLLDMDGSGTTFTFEFVDSMLDEIGVEFEVYANDNVTFVESLGNIISRSFNEAQSSALPSLVFNDWQMISIPYELENKEVNAIFNELADLEYKKQWRLMHYIDGAYIDAITGFTNIEIGLGYWLNVINQVEIDVGAGKANANVPTSISLNAGWNQIGNPFNTLVNWSSVRSDNGFGKVDNLFIYDKDEKAFISSTTLQPFEGAYVWANEAFPLEVRPVSSGGRIANVADHKAKIDGENWQLPIVLKTNRKDFQIAGFGMNRGASELKDNNDQLAPPRFENYIEMVTTKKEAVYPYFHTDIKPLKSDQIWEFELSSNHLMGEVTLEWDQLHLGSFFALWIVNENTGKVTDMKSNQQHKFYLNGSNDFTIHYSEDPNYIVLPKRLSMGDPFPNPAENVTNVPIMLPNRKEPYDIDLSVFDLNGNKVTSIANGKYPNGFHLVSWDPNENTQINNGIYFYRLSFKNENTEPVFKKLIIKK